MRGPRRCLPLLVAAAVPAALLAPSAAPLPASAAPLSARSSTGSRPVSAASGCLGGSDLLSSGPVARWRPARGLVVTAWNGTDARGHEVRLTVAAADIARIRLAAVAVGTYGDAAPTTSLTRGVRRAVAGINGDYFAYDWSGAAVPQGPAVVDGRAIRLPAGAHAVVGTDASGRPMAAALRVVGDVRRPARGSGGSGGVRLLTIASVNDDTDELDAEAADAVPAGRAVALVTPYLGRARPWRDREVVVRRGVVVAAGHRLSFGSGGVFGSGRAGRDDVLLAADGAAARTLRGLRPGNAVRLRYAPVTTGGTRMEQAIGSGAVMLRNGRDVAPCTWSGARSRPRTLVAWNARRTRLWLLALDGRGGGAPVSQYGGTYRQVTEVARALGATEAVMLDGGGSTTMALRGAGGAVRRVDAPQSAPQRPVPDGLVLIPR